MRLRGEEFNGRTVEEAIERGLAALKKRRADVDIEVLEEGKPANMLGLGGSDARVLISFPEPEEAQEEEPLVDEAEVPRRPEVAQEGVGEEEEPPPAFAEELVAGAAVLRELLEKMGVESEVEVRDQPESLLEVQGGDLGALIGRHGENLVALQLVVSLMTSRRVGRTVYVAIDIEGYRRRRESQLREIAHRVAGRVRTTQQAVTLEPMLAYERRVVHLALQDDRDVRTESVGVEPNRRVVVLPKRVQPGPPIRDARPAPRPGFARRPSAARPPYRRAFGERRGPGV